jgi:hypothetical protein
MAALKFGASEHGFHFHPMRIRNKYIVFVSHSAKDTWIAKQIAQHIKSSGARPFLDEAEIGLGEDFEGELLRFLNRANELLVLLTPWALERPYVWAELGAAWSRAIPIIAVLHGITPTDLQDRAGIPVFLKKRDLTDLNNVEKYFLDLKQRVNKRYRW